MARLRGKYGKGRNVITISKRGSIVLDTNGQGTRHENI